MRSAPLASRVRFPVDPRHVPPEKAARRLHLTLHEFESAWPRLRQRGFPAPDPDTGNYDLKAIDAWMDRQSGLTEGNRPRDAQEVVFDRLRRI